LVGVECSFFELNPTFNDDEKIELGFEWYSSWVRCSPENEKAWVGSAGDFQKPKIETEEISFACESICEQNSKYVVRSQVIIWHNSLATTHQKLEEVLEQ
jgi:hypothetical protein